MESVEYFTATLQTPYENVQLLTAAANITIYPDHDRKLIIIISTCTNSNLSYSVIFAGTTLQFEYPSYSMLEGEMTSICIVSEADIQRPVAVNVIPSSGGKSFMAVMDIANTVYPVLLVVGNFTSNQALENNGGILL